MRTVYVKLPDIRAVQAFVDAIANLPGRFDLVADGYLLDAKSLIGIASMNRREPIRLDIHEDTPNAMAAVAAFLFQDGAKG